jgi:hypothetical protein
MRRASSWLSHQAQEKKRIAQREGQSVTFPPFRKNRRRERACPTGLRASSARIVYELYPRLCRAGAPRLRRFCASWGGVGYTTLGSRLMALRSADKGRSHGLRMILPSFVTKLSFAAT